MRKRKSALGPQLVRVRLSDCLTMAHKNNPKEHKIDQLIASFVRFGFVAFPTVDENTMVMVAGHGRCQALEQMRIGGATPPKNIKVVKREWMVPVVRGIEFENEDERDAYLVADNQHVMSGGWRFDALTEFLRELEPVGFEGLGFEQLELDTMFGTDDDPDPDPDKPNPNSSDDPGPVDPSGPPITSPGDIWELGDHRLLCGDCRLDLSPLFDGAAAQLAITSPPYARCRVYDPSSGFVPISPEEYVAWFEPVQANVARYLREDGSWCLNIRASSDEGERSLYVFDLVIAHARSWGWKFIDDFCWRNRRNGVPGTWPNRFKNAWEPIFHFGRTAMVKFRPAHVMQASTAAFVYDPELERRDDSRFPTSHHEAEGVGLALPSNVIDASAELGQGHHTAPFPMEIPSFFISALTDEGDIVFEPFAGSGTTLIAAENLRRRCLAVELSPIYCDGIVQRWEHLTKRRATRTT